MVSCSTDDLSIAVIIAPVCLIPLILFGGFFLNAGSVITFVKIILCIIQLNNDQQSLEPRVVSPFLSFLLTIARKVDSRIVVIRIGLSKFETLLDTKHFVEIAVTSV